MEIARDPGLAEGAGDGPLKRRGLLGRCRLERFSGLATTATDRQIVPPLGRRRTSPANPHRVDRCASRVRRVRSPRAAIRDTSPPRSATGTRSQRRRLDLRSNRMLLGENA
jgi:hypothetical protein